MKSSILCCILAALLCSIYVPAFADPTPNNTGVNQIFNVVDIYGTPVEGVTLHVKTPDNINYSSVTSDKSGKIEIWLKLGGIYEGFYSFEFHKDGYALHGLKKPANGKNMEILLLENKDVFRYLKNIPVGTKLIINEEVTIPANQEQITLNSESFYEPESSAVSFRIVPSLETRIIRKEKEFIVNGNWGASGLVVTHPNLKAIVCSDIYKLSHYFKIRASKPTEF